MKKHTDNFRKDTPIIAPRLIDVSEVEIKPTDWLWYNKIPYGDITIIVGLQKQGKSMITIYMATVITQGRQSENSPREPNSIIPQRCNWCDGSPCEKGSVLFFAGEDRAGEYARRLKANGADLSKIRILDGADVIDPNSGKSEEINVSVKSLDVIEAAIEQTEEATGLPVRMVVIDPISNYWGGINEKDSVQVRDALHPLQRFFQKRQTALILIQHFTKSVGKNAMQRVMGSVAITNISRNIWGVFKDTDGLGKLESERERCFLHVASNYCIDPMGIEFRITPHGRVEIVDTEVTMGGDEFESTSAASYKSSALKKAYLFQQWRIQAGRNFSDNGIVESFITIPFPFPNLSCRKHSPVTLFPFNAPPSNKFSNKVVPLPKLPANSTAPISPFNDGSNSIKTLYRHQRPSCQSMLTVSHRRLPKSNSLQKPV